MLVNETKRGTDFWNIDTSVDDLRECPVDCFFALEHASVEDEDDKDDDDTGGGGDVDNDAEDTCVDWDVKEEEEEGEEEQEEEEDENLTEVRWCLSDACLPHIVSNWHSGECLECSSRGRSDFSQLTKDVPHQ